MENSNKSYAQVPHDDQHMIKHGAELLLGVVAAASGIFMWMIMH